MPFEIWSDRRNDRAQGALFFAESSLPKSEGHPFYVRLNQLLATIDFDAKVEAKCEKFCADGVVRPRYSYNPDGYSAQDFMRPALLRGPHEILLAFCIGGPNVGGGGCSAQPTCR